MEKFSLNKTFGHRESNVQHLFGAYPLWILEASITKKHPIILGSHLNITAKYIFFL